MSANRKSAVKEQFDKVSDKYLSRRLTAENIRETQRILDLVKRNSKYDSVLDIGCGSGTITEALLDISDQVWGIDISQEMVRIASERFKESEFKGRVHFTVGDAENLEFPSESFNAVFCIGVLRYLDSWEKALKEMYRVLKPGGVSIMTFYYRFSPYWFSMCCLYRPLLPLIFVVKRKPLRDCLLLYKAEPLPFSYLKFKKSFSRIGFKDLEVQHSGFTIFPFNRLFPRLSTYIYLKLESAFFNCNVLGWLGSICIVKSIKE